MNTNSKTGFKTLTPSQKKKKIGTRAIAQLVAAFLLVQSPDSYP